MRLARRPLIAALPSLAAIGTLPAWMPGRTRASEPEDPPRLFLSAGADAGLVHHVAGFDGDGETLFAHRLPGRGHHVAVSPDRRTAVVCARRAGRFALMVNLADFAVTHRIDAADNRHFYGHSAFSADGRLLFTTENAYDLGEGRIGIYDAADGYRRIGEWDARGIGPHQVLLHPDGETLIVANGGILTHPDSGREMLNLDTMAPNLALIDARDGTLVGRVDMPDDLHRLSSRHIAVAGDGRIAVVMQYQGDAGDLPPLVATVDGPGGFRFGELPEPVLFQMANYCGSTSFARDGASFGVSSPRGGVFTFWSRDGEFLTSVSVGDGCGIAADGRPGGYILSSGTGGLWRFSLADQRLERLVAPGQPIAHWDNHLTAT
ncbi:MAG: DUF1513 domain-containing protein [Azospirillaceae bacterium]